MSASSGVRILPAAGQGLGRVRDTVDGRLRIAAEIIRLREWAKLNDVAWTVEPPVLEGK